MRKILIFGNSGSGKSTQAKKFCADHKLAHLDLDNLAWQATTPPTRKPLADSKQEILAFTSENPGWVIEGCYTDLLEIVALESNEIVFMNLPKESCINNAKARPWEPHKYPSKQAQDANLNMLLAWISDYYNRDDVCSRSAHTKFYDAFFGIKSIITRNA